MICISWARKLAWVFFRPRPVNNEPRGERYGTATIADSGRLQAHRPSTQHDLSDARREKVSAAGAARRACSRLAGEYKAEAEAADGSDIFAIQARKRGWLTRLRRDMSGVKTVEIKGERATVETVRGTRYPFRRRENGIWGLTLFTATLVSEAEKAARDYRMVEKAADDYDRVKAGPARSAKAPPRRDAQ